MDHAARPVRHRIDRDTLRASWRSWVSYDAVVPAGPAWLQWVWTLLLCAVLAIGFTVLGFAVFAHDAGAWRNLGAWAMWFGRNLVVCTTIGLIVHGLFQLLQRRWVPPSRVARWAGWQRTLYFTGVPMLGVAVGWPLGVTLAGGELLAWVSAREGRNLIAGSVLVALLVTALLHQYFSAKTAEILAERRATEAQLRLLQAQMEPHFLFNTLANVHAMVDTAPAQAKAMLGAFTEYLRASLATLRRDAVPLADELALAEAYLRVQQCRMEDRLRFTIEADEAARRALLPPLLLQPLVENAVLHGIEPQLDGGRVAVRARLLGDRLRLEVQDDGPGPDAPRRQAGGGAGSGIALENLRERLRQRHGGAAALTIAAAPAGGTLATLDLPAELPLH